MFRSYCFMSLTLIAAMLVAPAAQATILTFTQTGSPNQSLFSTTLANYGDNVNSLTQISGPNTFSYGQGNAFTPNIDVAYSSTAGGGNLGPMYYIDGVWTNPVNYLHAFSGSSHFLTFNSNNSMFGTRLNSMSFDLYTGIGQPGNSSITWNVRSGSTIGPILATGTETGWTNGENRFIDLGGVSIFDTAVLEIVLTSVGAGSIGIDDLNFDQVQLPEPGTASLLAIGAAALCVSARRRRPQQADASEAFGTV